MPPDKMTAVVRIYPQTTNGKPYTKKDIISELSRYGIRFGVVESVIDEYITNRSYCTNMIFAKGKEPNHGSSAKIEYHFNTATNSKPKENEDGSVDFHQLNIFIAVKKGDVLATLIPINKGTPGIDVMGNPVLPRKNENKILRFGRNILLTEDKLKIISEVDGHVKLEGDMVFVSHTYDVPMDVDTSTGDIEYEGDVIVHGNVRTGFTVRAKGDIIVNGVVEGGCLYADGKIVLKRGIQGVSKGELRAKGDIVSKFIESSNVYAGGNITTEAILHSNVISEGEIIVNGKKGFVVGGTISAKTQMKMKTAGSKMGTTTVIKVGVDPTILDEVKELQEKIRNDSEELLKTVQTLDMFRKKLAQGAKFQNDKLLLIKSSTENKAKYEEEIEKNKARVEECKEIIASNQNGKVYISGEVYPGVRVFISNKIYYVTEELKYCQLRIDKGEIIVSAL